MADDQIISSTSEPEIEEEGEEGDDEDTASVSNNSDNSNRYRNSDEGGPTIRGGHEIERRIEMLDKDQESIESRMTFRERTSRQLSNSMLFLSFNLEFIAGIHAYLRIRSRNLGWKARVIRVLPLFLIPAVATLFSSLLCQFTSIVNLRDRKSLEKIRKERLAKIQELARSQFQNYHGESSSVASTSRSNFPEASRSTSGTNSHAHEHLENPDNNKKRPKCLVICTNCRMHNGFASKEMLQSVSYTCSHCKAFNGRAVSSSAIHPPQSIPYNPPYNEHEIEESLPRDIFIEEVTPSQEITDPEMDPTVMIIRESPSAYGSSQLLNAPDSPIMIRDLPSDFAIEEITQNREINDPELGLQVISQESTSAVGEVEGFTSLTEIPRDVLIEEITQNQEINEHKLELPVVFQESPSIGGGGPSTVLDTPFIEELTPNQEIVNHEMDPPVMFVQVSPSVTGEEDLLRENSPRQMDTPVNTVTSDVMIPVDDVSTFTVQELPLETRESHSTEVETIVTYPDTDAADVTPTSPIEIDNSNTNLNNNYNDSEDESTKGWSGSSGQFAENWVRVTEVQGQEGINEDAALIESRETEGPEMNVTYPDTNFEIEDDGRETRGDELTQSQDPLDQDQLSLEENVSTSEGEYGSAGPGSDEEENSVRVRNDIEEEQNEKFMSSYNDDDETDHELNGSRTISGDPINSVREVVNWTSWQQAEETEISTMEDPQVDLSSQSLVTNNIDDQKNSVGSLAFRSKSTATQDPRKGIGGNLKKEEKKGSHGELENIELGEVSDKEGSIKKGTTEGSEADPVVKATAALLSSNAVPDPKSKPFSGVGSTPGSRWGRSNDFEPAKVDGLRHRRSFTPPFLSEPPLPVTEPTNVGSSHLVPPTENEEIQGPVMGF